MFLKDRSFDCFGGRRNAKEAAGFKLSRWRRFFYGIRGKKFWKSLILGKNGPAGI